MVEQWLEVHIFFTQDQESNVPLILQEVVKYCADQLESESKRKTFHYLFEPRIDGNPKFEILFRIEARENIDLAEIEETVIERINQFLHLVDGRQITNEYHGEAGADGFGQDGWELTKQLFEIGSKIAIGRLSDDFRNGEKFIPGKLMHCFLNQQTVDEEKFHAVQLIGRVLVTLDASSVTLEVEMRARRLLEEALTTIRSSRIRIL